MAENNVEIVIKTRTEMEEMQKFISSLQASGDQLKDLKQLVEDAFKTPDTVQDLLNQAQTLQEKIQVARESGNKREISLLEEEARSLEKNITLQRIYLDILKEKELIKRDERLDKIAELGLSGDVDWTVAESAYDRMIKSRYSSMSGALGLAGDLVGAEMGIARGEVGGAGGQVQWSAMQTVKDEFVRNIMGTINTVAGEVTGRAFGGGIELGGFAGIGSAIKKNDAKGFMSAITAGGMGILSSMAQWGLNAAQEAAQNEIAGGELLRMMGYYTRTDKYGNPLNFNPKSTTEYVNELIAGPNGIITKEMIPKYSLSYNDSINLLMQGAEWSNEGTPEDLYRNIMPLMRLKTLGLDTVSYGGTIGGLLTGGGRFGGNSTDTQFQTEWLNSVMPLLMTTGYTGATMENQMKQWVEPLAQIGSSLSGQFTGEQLQRNLSPFVRAYKNTNYHSFMLNNPQNLMNLMGAFQGTFTNNSDENMDAFLMRAYGYKGGGLDEWANYQNRVQQGFFGDQGRENLQAVWNQLKKDLPTQNRETLATILAQRVGNGVSRDQLLPLLKEFDEGMGIGTSVLTKAELAKYTNLDDTAGITDTQSQKGKTNQFQQNIGNIINRALQDLTDMMQKMMPLFNKVAQGIDKLDKTLGELGLGSDDETKKITEILGSKNPLLLAGAFADFEDLDINRAISSSSGVDISNMPTKRLRENYPEFDITKLDTTKNLQDAYIKEKSKAILQNQSIKDFIALEGRAKGELHGNQLFLTQGDKTIIINVAGNLTETMKEQLIDELENTVTNTPQQQGQ